jgi:uncharacterized membrane protein
VRIVSERARFLLATLCGLVLSVGVHIMIVLGIPSHARRDAFSLLRGPEQENGAAEPALGDPRIWLPKHDPAASVAACAFDLANGPVRVSTKTNSLFQSLSFHARGGSVFYAVTDRAAVRGELELVVMTRRQLDEALAAEDEEAPNRDVRIVAPRREGFVVIRVVAPFPSYRQEAEATAKAVSCTVDTAGEG